MTDITPSQFIQIATGNTGVHALDTTGRVWRYVPARDIDGTQRNYRYAFWTRLTDERAHNNKDKGDST